MQLLTATFKRNNKTIKRAYHAQRCNDGSVLLWHEDRITGMKRVVVHDMGAFDPATAAALSGVCRAHLHVLARSIGRRGWHRIA